ncbi:translation initiation factor IF-2 [Equus quagga]|uniref:translation initiation factor IF-2 n=1 Tax=Equus quagga TaxID=89248 RepID=UPI001EE298D2|nr:translation initiation factor IF-2 [Equus quagga]
MASRGQHVPTESGCDSISRFNMLQPGDLEPIQSQTLIHFVTFTAISWLEQTGVPEQGTKLSRKTRVLLAHFPDEEIEVLGGQEAHRKSDCYKVEDSNPGLARESTPRTWEQSRVGRASGAFRAGEGVNPQGGLSPPHPVRRPRQGGEPGTETQWFVVSGQQLPNSREAADPGYPTERTQPGERETKTQSERLGEGAGAGPSTPIARSPGARRLRASPTSLRRARGGRPRHLAKPGVPTKPAPFPFPWGGNLRIAQPREPPVPGPAQPAPQSGPWVEAARRTRGVDFSFGAAGRSRSPPFLRRSPTSGSPRTQFPAIRVARRRSGHGQSDGGQARTGAAASGTAPTHTDLFKSNNCCNNFE